MVRRLVEQQQIGLREQQRGERDAHPPAARKAVERAVLCSVSSNPSPTRMRAARARRGIGVDRDQPLVDLAEPVGIVARLALVQQRGALDVGGEHGLERRRLTRRRLLRDIAEPAAARHVDAAGVGVERPGDHLHQRRLASTFFLGAPPAPTAWTCRCIVRSTVSWSGKATR